MARTRGARNSQSKGMLFERADMMETKVGAEKKDDSADMAPAPQNGLDGK
jgi:hypothetical protein